jgi:hypothetical protein
VTQAGCGPARTRHGYFVPLGLAGFGFGLLAMTVNSSSSEAGAAMGRILEGGLGQRIRPSGEGPSTPRRQDLARPGTPRVAAESSGVLVRDRAALAAARSQPERPHFIPIAATRKRNLGTRRIIC